ncbi:RidA family protein [Vibrio aestuarianus]|uniref:RidA family protein n=1 Tax=Vibrio aestuarianus TaxID=28171 RepID=A0A9X4F434_9VIBR|nr:RidA family protein [Vibrio aestuarianus]MDE1244195.1 RidA family protein [Vibrio aestuarianus]
MKRKYYKSGLVIALSFWLSAAHANMANHSSSLDSTHLQSVNPKGVSIPGISQGMLVNNSNLLFISGQVAMNEKGDIVGSDLKTQLEQVFKNLGKTLSEAGANYRDIAKLTVYFRDYKPNKLLVYREVRDKYIQLDNPPASTIIGVQTLFSPKVLVEIEAIVTIPQSTI